jgi:hypothetical protein
VIDVIHGSALDMGPDELELFDVQISDAPYSPHVHENCASVGKTSGGLGVHDRDLGFEALTPELRDHLAMAAQCVRRWSLIYTDVEGIHDWIAAAGNVGAEYVRSIPWIRWSQPQLSGDRPPTCFEVVIALHPQLIGVRGGKKPIAKRWNGPGGFDGGVFGRRCMRGADKHPTEKGLDLVLDQVSWYSDPGESVVDLTAGVCTTALACRLLGRDCVCVEKNAEFARKGATRAKAQLSPRDRARAEEWCTTTFAEADAAAREPLAADGSNRNTIRRAECRLADVERVRGAL